MRTSLRQQTHIALDTSTGSSTVGRIVKVFVGALICLNIVAVAMETVDGFAASFSSQLQGFESFSIAVFTAEYLLRLWACTVTKTFGNPIWGRMRYAVTPLALIDLASILPAYLPFVFPDLRFLRIFRLLRLMRLLKLGRHSETLQLLGYVLWSKRHDLAVTAFGAVLLAVAAASGIYLVEHNAQPKAFPSIPGSLWWAVVTLTTVGYGDAYPVTPLGRIIGGGVAVLGIGLFALPAGILASGFSEAIQRKRSGPAKCPHCGGDLDGCL